MKTTSMRSLVCLGAVGLSSALVACGGSSPEWTYPPTPTFQSNVGQPGAPAPGQPDPAMQQQPAAAMAPAEPQAAAMAAPASTATAAAPAAPAAGTTGGDKKQCEGIGEKATITAKEVPGGLVLDVEATSKETQADLDKSMAAFEAGLKATKAGVTDDAAAKACPLFGLKQEGAVVFVQKEGKKFRVVLQPKLQKDLPSLVERAAKVATEPFEPSSKEAPKAPAAPAAKAAAASAPPSAPAAPPKAPAAPPAPPKAPAAPAAPPKAPAAPPAPPTPNK